MTFLTFSDLGRIEISLRKEERAREDTLKTLKITFSLYPWRESELKRDEMEIPTVTPTGTQSGGTGLHGQSKRKNNIEKNMNEKVQVLPKQFNPDLVIAGHG